MLFFYGDLSEGPDVTASFTERSDAGQLLTTMDLTPEDFADPARLEAVIAEIFARGLTKMALMQHMSRPLDP